ncbi:VOC family protein [Nocardia sp. 2YAB30]|uniref:VOC family protein n=1 Tax=Nocardia sp. 2YAB30 TaxID=3233022 RepID=UPI003F948925
MPALVHFEIRAHRPEDIAAFYRSVFGWTIEPFPALPDYQFVPRSVEDGVNGGIASATTAVAPVVNLYEVENLDTTLEHIRAAGGQILREPTVIRTVGWVAYAADTEGNPFGVIVHDKTAGTHDDQ